MSGIELGCRVRDRMTGFAGIATARSEWLYGCVRILVEPEELREGKPVEGIWFEEERLENQGPTGYCRH